MVYCRVRANALVAGLALLSLSRVAAAQATPDWSALERPRTHPPHPTATAISAEELRTRLFQFADDSMNGRLLGEPGNVKGAEYIAREIKRLGLEPAGDNGSYFQFVPVVERRFDERVTLKVGDAVLTPWKDFLPRDQGPAAATRRR
jgi:hypothetical protein